MNGMKMWRRDGPWTIQVYWPYFAWLARSTIFHFQAATSLRIGGGAYGIQVLGFGFGVCPSRDPEADRRAVAKGAT